MLRRHQCCIDLRTNELLIGSSGARAPFLSEQDLPQHARLEESATDTSKITKLLSVASVTSLSGKKIPRHILVTYAMIS